MMYHFGLESYIDYIVDDHPSKHGCYSPGQHIPVFSTTKIYEETAKDSSQQSDENSDGDVVDGEVVEDE